MKKITILILFIASTIVSQTNTEVFLFDIKKTETGYELTNKKNISTNEGYDSQPHFYDNYALLFASSRNGQTDIVKYTIDTGIKEFINYSPEGGEYSPQRIPGTDDISAVRSKQIIRNLEVAYPLWASNKLLFSAVIGEKSLELVKSDLKNKTNVLLEKNIGRSLHCIPGTNSISFISKKKPLWEIFSIDITTLTINKITNLDDNYEDIAWISKDVVLQAKKNQLLQFNIKTDSVWKELINKDSLQIQNISRITISPDKTKIAIVGE